MLTGGSGPDSPPTAKFATLPVTVSGRLRNLDSYMVQIRRKIPIHLSRTRAGGAPTIGRMRRLAPAVAAMLAFLTLAACYGGGGRVLCEETVPERVIFGALTLGLTEMQRAARCPQAYQLNDLKIKAREGDPDAQAAVGMYYFSELSAFYPDRELVQRSAAKLLRCAAEGGSHAAQSSPYLGAFLEEQDAAKIIYKYSKISIQRKGCDCNARFSPSFLLRAFKRKGRYEYLCHSRSLSTDRTALCPSKRRAAEKLSPTQIIEIEDDISVYEPSPRACDVAILKE